jgi:manganese/zinc/iron transport system ATP- binding protein
MGPNGAGKSTLIKAIMGLQHLASGYVRIFGESLEKVRLRVSYVPQRESVDWDFPASVLEVVLMGLYGKMGLFQRPSKKDKEKALHYLSQVQMEAFAGRQISQLSGGQQQRVFLARALAQEADLYLMDEPFVGVDATTEQAIIQLLQGMKKEGKTLIVVHHDLQSAAQYFDWLVLLNLRLIASAPTEQALTPALLRETYGGRLTLLSEVGDLLKKSEFPSREQP